MARRPRGWQKQDDLRDQEPSGDVPNQSRLPPSARSQGKRQRQAQRNKREETKAERWHRLGHLGEVQSAEPNHIQRRYLGWKYPSVYPKWATKPKLREDAEISASATAPSSHASDIVLSCAASVIASSSHPILSQATSAITLSSHAPDPVLSQEAPTSATSQHSHNSSQQNKTKLATDLKDFEDKEPGKQPLSRSPSPSTSFLDQIAPEYNMNPISNHPRAPKDSSSTSTKSPPKYETTTKKKPHEEAMPQNTNTDMMQNKTKNEGKAQEGVEDLLHSHKSPELHNLPKKMDTTPPPTTPTTLTTLQETLTTLSANHNTTPSAWLPKCFHEENLTSERAGLLEDLLFLELDSEQEK